MDNVINNADFLTGVLSMFKDVPGEKGLPNSQQGFFQKNVIPALGSTFNRTKRINPLLTSVEITRTYNTGLVLAKAFFDFNNKRKEDVKSSTIVSQSKSKIEKGTDIQVPRNISAIMTAVASIIALSVLIYKFLGPIGSFAGKLLVKIPKIPNIAKLVKSLKFTDRIESFFIKAVSQIKNILGLFTTSKEIKQATSIKPGVFKMMFRSIGEFFSKKIGFLLKKIPIIGSLMSFTFAFLRWRQGKYITSILEILSGIANLVPGAGTVVSLAIDGVILLSDLLSSGDMAAKTSGFVHGTKIAGKSLLYILKNTAKTLGLRLLKGLKFIPFIGGIAGLALAYMRFKAGDWIAGTFELISAIADFIPGVGNIISLILDGGLLLYDILRTKKSKEEKTVKPTSNTSFSDIAKKWGDKLIQIIWYVPGISGLLYVGRSMSKFLKGDFKGGLKDLGLSIIGFSGGKGLVDFLSYTLGLFTTKSNEPKDIAAKKVSFADIISAGIVKMLDVFSGLYTNIIDWAKSKIDDAKEKMHELNEKYNPIIGGYNLITGYDKRMEFLEKENERLTELGKESYRKSQEINKKPIDPEWDRKRRERLGPEVHDRVRERERKAGRYAESKSEPIKIPQLASKPEIIERIPAAASLRAVKDIPNNKELEDQTNLIKLQNELLVQLVTTSKEQLNVSKKSKPSVSVVDSGSNTSNVNMNNAFSTSRADGRSMYMASPYSINPSYA